MSASGWQSVVNSRFMMILGAVVGVFLILLTVGIVFGLEHYSLNTARGLEAKAGQAVSASADKVNPANEGKLVHVSGEATTDDTVSDPQLGVRALALRLAREVEVRQWKENKSEKKQGKEKVITYDYEQIWSSKKPPSSGTFNKKAGHENLPAKPYEDARYSAATVKLGAFTLTPGQVEKLPADEPLAVTEEMLARVPAELKGQVKATADGQLYVGANPDAPQVGDCRIRYKVARPQTVSVVARQEGSRLVPYPVEGGQDIDLVERGTHSAQEMFASARSSSALLGWVGRVLGLALMAVALFLVLRPAAAAASGAPPESVGFNVRVGLFAAAGALPAVLGVVGLRWLFAAPLAGLGLMFLSFLLLASVALLSFSRSVGLRAGGAKWGAEERDYFRRLALDPDNQALRLEFADKLEKKGNPLGEFIRLSHDLDAIPEGDPRREERDRRWGELLDAHGGKWYQGLRQLRLEPQLMGNFFPALWMHNGIIDHVTVDLAGVLPERAEQLFAAAPGLRSLEIHNIRTEQGVTGWKDTTYEPNVPAVVKAPQLEQLSALKMSSIGLKASDLEAVAASPYLANLTELDFSYNKVGPEGAAAVGQSTTLKRLHVLELRGCDIGEAGAVALARSANLAGLVKLNLGANAIGPKGVATLVASPHLKNLQSLLLDDNAIGPAATANIALSPHLRELTELDLSSNDIGPQGAAALARSENLANVETLKLNYDKLGGAGLRALATSPHLGRLRLLEVHSNEIDDVGAQSLAASTVIRSLEELSLAYNNIGDEGLKALAAWPGLAKVRKLSLRENKAGWAGVRAIALSPHLTAIQELDLSKLDIGLAGAQALAAAPLLRTLKYLWLNEVELTADAEKLLRDHFGDALQR
jgi:uncharacterized protein (TIGR02996 family)